MNTFVIVKMSPSELCSIWRFLIGTGQAFEETKRLEYTFAYSLHILYTTYRVNLPSL